MKNKSRSKKGHQSTRKGKHIKTRRIQRGGEMYVDLRGHPYPRDGEHYMANNFSLDQGVFYNGQVKAIVAPAPPICRADVSNCEPEVTFGRERNIDIRHPHQQIRVCGRV